MGCVTMKVLMTPFVENPYQSILKEKLEDRNIEVASEKFIPGYKLFLEVLSECPDVIHLNWVDRFYITTDDVLWKNLAAGVFFSFNLILVSFFTRIVWTAHNKHNHEEKSPRLDWIMRKFVFWISDSVQVWEKNSKRELCKYLNVSDEKIIQIPHGNYLPVHPEENLPSQENARKELNLEMKSKIILFFGNIRPYKQVPLLAEKFEELKDDNSKLLIVGRARQQETKNKLSTIAEKSEDIEFIEGFIDENDVPLYFRASDIVALPFRDIFNSGSIIMAMSMGRAVLTPKIKIINSVVPNSNILYENISEGMKRLFSEDRKNMRKIGDQNLEHAKLENNWNEITDKTVKMYRA
ncbi:glycosyltransferase [Candidatus Nanohalovita haloferacivicina]|uniref:glycosyltransferase n=1 Tax=Candidatus Nanohalovita haloferacivicina TaxID=2978046 RepID=UPI00325FD522|nr:Beta-1,4-mannosyltransferase [Candidatus Nanohalobia archaeon BNXNv]